MKRWFKTTCNNTEIKCLFQCIVGLQNSILLKSDCLPNIYGCGHFLSQNGLLEKHM